MGLRVDRFRIRCVLNAVTAVTVTGIQLFFLKIITLAE